MMHRPIGQRAAAALTGLLAWAAAGLPAIQAAEDLTAAAQRIARQQAERFGKGYSARVDLNRHVVYVSALDDRHLQQTMDRLASFADAFRRTLPTTRPAWNITVVLPTVEDYAKLDPPFEGCVGFYNPAGRRLVAVDRGRTMLHEFAHALHHADMAAAKQVHPMWVTEGLATFFEAGQVTPSGFKPEMDLRLATAQRAVKDRKAIPLERLLTMGPKAFREDASLAYAQARYVMLYLHQQNRLADWYRRYKATFTSDPDGVKAFEAALASRLFLIEPQWHKWLLSLEIPSSEFRMQQGRLGLELANDPRGVKVVGLMPGSAAQIAGRIRVGDVIRTFNGHEVTNPGQMVGAIRAAGVLKTVEVDLLRNGRAMTVLQPLGEPPAR